MINTASIGRETLSGVAADAVFPAIGPAAVVAIWRRLKGRIFDSYRPELHYMRGPGPKWREKHAQDRRTPPAAQ